MLSSLGQKVPNRVHSAAKAATGASATTAAKTQGTKNFRIIAASFLQQPMIPSHH
jgi:hypothetical protein